MNEFMFRVDCNPPGTEKYSLPILVETYKPELTNDEVLQYCIDNLEFDKDHHCYYVTDIKQIERWEYQDLILKSYQ